MHLLQLPTVFLAGKKRPDNRSNCFSDLYCLFFVKKQLPTGLLRVLKVYLISPRIVHTLRRKCGEPFAMKLIWIILNIIQALIILGWTAFCGIFGILLMLLLWNRGLVIYIMSRIIWSPVICLVSGVRVKKFGVEKIDRKRSFIYVANHSSLYDIVALSRVMPVPLFFIAKLIKELYVKILFIISFNLYQC